MTSKQRKNLILSLIKDDLINSKLIRGLNKAGLEATQYCLFLSETIFDLMGYGSSEREESVFEEYIRLTEQSENVDISKTTNTLDGLANEIYRFLLQNKTQKK